jgi:glucose/arabinose dehydrogenase
MGCRPVVACASILLAAASAVRAQYDCSGVPETSNTTLAAYPVVTGLSVPVFVTSPPGDRERLFIVEKQGRIKIHTHGTAPSSTSTFLDITGRVSAFGGEMGLLGLAFDPDYATTGYFWVYYTESSDGDVYSVVARYTASSPAANTADATSEMRVLRLVQPDLDHKAGMLMFGLDGFLYVATGDGGGPGDLHGYCGNGQSRSVLLGKILRLDVRGIDPASTRADCALAGATYRVPRNNPFNDGPGVGLCDEIWAYGLRNPWRPSIDPLTGDLYIADVGQDCWEEIDWSPGGSPGGENYGWRQMEGNACYSEAGCNSSGVICAGSPSCYDPSLVHPVLTYAHDPGCAVTGGYVYRGCRMPAFRGRYFFADVCAGFVRTFRMVGGAVAAPQDLTRQLRPDGSHFVNVTSFGVDGLGEQYLTEYFGTVWKLAPRIPDLEVSARGAADMLRLAKTGDWTWEDLFHATDVPVMLYRVYRGTPNGLFSCVFHATTPRWPSGGDAAVPAPGQLFAYVVTAIDPSGQETKPGATGTFDASTCP